MIINDIDSELLNGSKDLIRNKRIKSR